MQYHNGLPVPAAQLKLALGAGFKTIDQLSAETGLPPVAVRLWGTVLVEKGHAMGQHDDAGWPIAFCRPIPQWAYDAMFGEDDPGSTPT